MDRDFEKYFKNKDRLSLEKILWIIKSVLTEQKSFFGQVGYVSGPINSKENKKINENLQSLKKMAEKLSLRFDYPIYSAPDFISSNLYWRINGSIIMSKDWESFWGDLLRSGNITDVFMMPRWKTSQGAKKEYRVAIQKRIHIYFL